MMNWNLEVMSPRIGNEKLFTIAVKNVKTARIFGA